MGKAKMLVGRNLRQGDRDLRWGDRDWRLGGRDWRLGDRDWGLEHADYLRVDREERQSHKDCQKEGTD